MDYTEIKDLSIRITDMLVETGFVPDCTDTYYTTEYDVQDMIADILCEHFNIPEES